MSYDYTAAYDAIDRNVPGPVGECYGCSRCRAGNHAACRGCFCRCSGQSTWWNGYRQVESRCGQECREHYEQEATL